MAKTTVTAADGTEYDRASLVEDGDGLWARMGDALALVIPSAEYEARRAVDAAEMAVRQAEMEREAAIQAEIRAMAVERLAARGE